MSSLIFSKGSLFLPSGVHTRNWPQTGRDPRALGGWGDLPVKHSQQLMGGFLNGVCEVISMICIPLMPPNSPMWHSPSSSPHPVSPGVQHISVFWMGRQRSGSAWQHSNAAGEARHSLICSYFPSWEESRPEKVSLSTKLCCLVDKVVWAKWNVLTLFSASISGSLCSVVCWNVSTEFPDFHKGSLVYVWLSKPVFSVWKTVETFYSTMIMMSLLHSLIWVNSLLCACVCMHVLIGACHSCPSFVNVCVSLYF